MWLNDGDSRLLLLTRLGKAQGQESDSEVRASRKIWMLYDPAANRLVPISGLPESLPRETELTEATPGLYGRGETFVVYPPSRLAP